MTMYQAWLSSLCKPKSMASYWEEKITWTSGTAKLNQHLTHNREGSVRRSEMRGKGRKGEDSEEMMLWRLFVYTRVFSVCGVKRKLSSNNS